jgi:AI-2 transport protein TqsA
VDSVLGPKVLGRGLDVASIITILSLVLWGFILGPVGALLSVPLTVLVKMVLLDHYPASRWLSVALGAGGGDESHPDGGAPASVPAGPTASAAGAG